MSDTPFLQSLRSARADNRLLPLPLRQRPRSLSAAYEIAAALVGDHPVAGYKIGATSEPGRRVLKLRRPFFGRILGSLLQRSPAVVRHAHAMLSAEPEIGLELGMDLPVRRRPYARAEVAAAIRRVIPLVELNAPTFAQPLEAGGLCLIADNGVNAGAVIGGPGSVRLDVIRDTQVSVWYEGTARTGAAPQAPDDPLSSVHWLVNALGKRNLPLRSGQVVATGAMCAPLNIESDGQLTADFGSLGTIHVSFIHSRK